MRNACWGFCLVVSVVGLLWGCTAWAWPVTAQRSTSPQPQLQLQTTTTGTKYNPQFGTAWKLALKQKAPQRWLDCVIRVKTPPTSDEVAQLKATGFQPRSIIHDIITGRIQAGKVARFLKLPFVVSVEGGGMGGPKGTRGMK